MASLLSLLLTRTAGAALLCRYYYKPLSLKHSPRVHTFFASGKHTPTLSMQHLTRYNTTLVIILHHIYVIVSPFESVINVLHSSVNRDAQYMTPSPFELVVDILHSSVNRDASSLQPYSAWPNAQLSTYPARGVDHPCSWVDYCRFWRFFLSLTKVPAALYHRTIFSMIIPRPLLAIFSSTKSSKIFTQEMSVCLRIALANSVHPQVPFVSTQEFPTDLRQLSSWLPPLLTLLLLISNRGALAALPRPLLPVFSSTKTSYVFITEMNF